MQRNTNINFTKPDTVIKKYIAAASAVLLFLTICMPSLGLAFAAGNLVFLAVRYLLKGVHLGDAWKKWMIRGVIFGNIWILFCLLILDFQAFPGFVEEYENTVLYGRVFKENIPAFFREVYYGAILGVDSVLPTLFISPVLGLFGNSFSVYLLLIFNLFLVPFFIVFGAIVQEINPKCVPIMFVFVPFLTPVLCGSLETAGLLCAAIWCYMVYKRVFRKWVLGKDILLGLLTMAMLLMQHAYFAFFAGSVLAIFISGGIRRLYDKNFNIEVQAKNMGVICATVALLSLALFYPYVQKIVEIYLKGAAWHLQENLQNALAYYGIWPLLCIGVGIVGLFRKRTRQFTMFLLFQIVITFLLLGGMQVLEYAHCCLFAPALFLLTVTGIKALPKRREAAVMAFGIVMMLLFAYTHLPFSGGMTDRVLGQDIPAIGTMQTVNAQN